jgi:formylglycine-generating enzyme required for sulfatase activity
MVFVPGGQLMVGREDGDEYERPAHSASVSPFYLDKTEVTNADYKKFDDTLRFVIDCTLPQGRQGTFPAGTEQYP